MTLTPAKSTKTFEETYQEEEEVVDEDGNKSMKMKTKTRTVMKTEGKDPVLSASNWRVKDKVWAGNERAAAPPPPPPPPPPPHKYHHHRYL